MTDVTDENNVRAFLTPDERALLDAQDAEAAAEIAARVEQLADPSLRLVWRSPADLPPGLPPDLEQMLFGTTEEES